MVIIPPVYGAAVSHPLLLISVGPTLALDTPLHIWMAALPTLFPESVPGGAVLGNHEELGLLSQLGDKSRQGLNLTMPQFVHP